MEKSGDLSGPAGICGDLSGPAGICGDLWGSLWPHTLRHSAIWLWGPASSPVLQPLAPGKILSRTGRTAPLRTLVSISDGAIFGLCYRIEPIERGVEFATITVAARGGIVGVYLGEIDWAARRHMRGPIIYFTFPLPYNSGGGRILLLAIHNILSSEKREMSLILQ